LAAVPILALGVVAGEKEIIEDCCYLRRHNGWKTGCDTAERIFKADLESILSAVYTVCGEGFLKANQCQQFCSKSLLQKASRKSLIRQILPRTLS
jgi:hypothetical protein